MSITADSCPRKVGTMARYSGLVDLPTRSSGGLCLAAGPAGRTVPQTARWPGELTPDHLYEERRGCRHVEIALPHTSGTRPLGVVPTREKSVSVSLKASLWALNDAPTQDPREVLLLFGLGNSAGSNGMVYVKNYETIARGARCSEATAKGTLRAMAKRGLIARGQSPSQKTDMWILPVMDEDQQ